MISTINPNNDLNDTIKGILRNLFILQKYVAQREVGKSVGKIIFKETTFYTYLEGNVLSTLVLHYSFFL